VTPSASRHSLRAEVSSVVRFEGAVGRSKRSSLFPAWLLLTGIMLVPSGWAVHLSGEGLKFTAGRAAIALLLVPAVARLLKAGRRLLSSDLLVFFTGAWMIGSRLQQDGLNDSAVAETIEIAGGYIVARAYFFGRPALQGFMQVFERLTIIVILLAVADTLTGKNLITAMSTGTYPGYRYGFVRAESTFEDSEHFGTFCCVAGSICLYLERVGFRRVFWVSFCFFGCLLALSSGPLLALAIMVCTSVYDRMLRQFTWRWKAFGMTIVGLLTAVYLLANHPTSWLIEHLTIDPSTGYFRITVFDYAFDQIAEHPFSGWGFSTIGSDDFLSNITVDSVWLVCAIRFGLPMMIFLLMTNVCTFFPLVRTKGRVINAYINDAGTAFTYGIMCFMLIGLTVHFWNATWMLWAVFLGVRASIKESQMWGEG
jgi:hypothetical protein